MTNKHIRVKSRNFCSTFFIRFLKSAITLSPDSSILSKNPAITVFNAHTNDSIKPVDLNSLPIPLFINEKSESSFSSLIK